MADTDFGKNTQQFLGLQPEAPDAQYFGRTPEETQLLAEQKAILAEQRAQLTSVLKQQQLLQPRLFEQLGVKPILDASGNITGFEPLSTSEAGIRKGFEDRVLAAQRGDLPINSALRKELDTREATLKETLRKNLGTGYETSTAGSRGLADFEQARSIAIDNASRSDLVTAEGLRQSGRALDMTLAQALGGVSNLSLPTVAGGMNLANTYAVPLKQLFADRGMQQGVEMFNVGNEYDANKMFTKFVQDWHSAEQANAHQTWQTAWKSMMGGGMGMGGGGG